MENGGWWEGRRIEDRRVKRMKEGREDRLWIPGAQRL